MSHRAEKVRHHTTTIHFLRTIDDVSGVPHLANAGQAGVKSFSGQVLKGVFALK
jgi:hypothetical protein